MNPTPAREWIQNYLLKVIGSLPDRPAEDYLLRSPAELTFHPANPVPRPNGARFGIWFDNLETPERQLLGSQLGVYSGFF